MTAVSADTYPILGGAFVHFGIEDAQAIRRGETPVKCTDKTFSDYKRAALEVWANVARIGSNSRALENGLDAERASRSPDLTRLYTEFVEFVPVGHVDGRRFTVLRCDYPDKVIGVMTDGIEFFNDVEFTDAPESTRVEREIIWGDMERRFRDHAASERANADAATAWHPVAEMHVETANL